MVHIALQDAVADDVERDARLLDDADSRMAGACRVDVDVGHVDRDVNIASNRNRHRSHAREVVGTRIGDVVDGLRRRFGAFACSSNPARCGCGGRCLDRGFHSLLAAIAIDSLEHLRCRLNSLGSRCRRSEGRVSVWGYRLHDRRFLRGDVLRIGSVIRICGRSRNEQGGHAREEHGQQRLPHLHFKSNFLHLSCLSLRLADGNNPQDLLFFMQVVLHIGGLNALRPDYPNLGCILPDQSRFCPLKST